MYSTDKHLRERAAQRSLTDIENIKSFVDGYLQPFFMIRIEAAKKIHPSYAELWSFVARLSGAGGKRLRPYIMYLAYHLQGPKPEPSRILPAAAAQELLHLAMLIHDDIIDRDTVRYGVKNVLGQYNDAYRSYVPDTGDRMHYSMSASVMAGDLLIAESYSLLQQCKVSSEHIAAAQSVISQAIFEVVGGELLDTEAAFRPAGDIDALMVARLKTASYSFVSPLVMGARLADVPEAIVSRLVHFGTALGVAYQLQDDLIGVFGDEHETGKSTTSDILEGKYTYLVSEFNARATETQHTQFMTIYKHPGASGEQLAIARRLLIESGAKAAVESIVGTYVTRATHELELIDMDDLSRTAFSDLITRCVSRIA